MKPDLIWFIMIYQESKPQIFLATKRPISPKRPTAERWNRWNSRPLWVEPSRSFATVTRSRWTLRSCSSRWTCRRKNWKRERMRGNNHPYQCFGCLVFFLNVFCFFLVFAWIKGFEMDSAYSTDALPKILFAEVKTGYLAKYARFLGLQSFFSKNLSDRRSIYYEVRKLLARWLAQVSVISFFGMLDR